MFPELFGTLEAEFVGLLDVLLDEDVVDEVDVVDESEAEELELLPLVVDEAFAELEEPDADVDEAEDGRPVPLD